MNASHGGAEKLKFYIGMKKIFTVIAAVLYGISFMTAAEIRPAQKSVIAVMKTYDSVDGVEFINIGPMLMNLARHSAGEDGDFMKYLDRMAVFSASDVPEKQMRKMVDDFQASLSGYEPLLQASEENENVTIYIAKKDEKTISEMIVYAQDSELAVIVMKGEIPVSEIENMASDAMNM